MERFDNTLLQIVILNFICTVQVSCKNNRKLQIGFLTKHSIVQFLEPRFPSRACKPSVEYKSPQQRIQQPTSRGYDHAQLSVKLK